MKKVFGLRIPLPFARPGAAAFASVSLCATLSAGAGLVLALGACDSDADVGEGVHDAGGTEVGDVTTPPADAAADAPSSDAEIIVDARPVPVSCAVTPCVVELANGNDSVCARLEDGTVRCWGTNLAGELGRGSASDTGRMSPKPEAVRDLADATSLAGSASTPSDAYCARRSDGSVACWGSNGAGVLGRVTEGSVDTADSPDVAPVAGVAGASAVFVGPSVGCATLAGHDLVCWGRNDAAQIFGHPRADEPLSATTLTLDEMPTSLAVADRGIVALTSKPSLTSGGIRGDVAWPAIGVLGREVSLDEALPGEVALAHVSAIAANGGRVCAIANGEVQCWGSGPTAPNSSIRPVPVGIGRPQAYAQTIAVGPRTACATLSDGSAYCWGDNSRGQLGTGTTDTSLVPVRVQGLAGRPVRMATMDTSTCALLVDGSVQCWGENAKGQLGIGTADPLGHLEPENVGFTP